MGSPWAAAFAAAALGVQAMLAVPAARAAESAVVLMYQRFGEADNTSTSVRLEQFEAHLAELRSGRYSVLSLPEVLDRLNGSQPLPDRTVAISIDVVSGSPYAEAWPRLRAANLPFTLFVPVDRVRDDPAAAISWQSLREMYASGLATIGVQSPPFGRMQSNAIDDNVQDLDRAASAVESALGTRPTLLSYRYGEYSRATQRAVQQAGFDAAFNQTSGVLHQGAEPFALPRFPLNEIYGDMDRFRLVSNALPLPVSELTPSDIQLRQNPPNFGFTVAPELTGQLQRLNCYAAGLGKARVERLGPRRIEVRLPGPFQNRRARINCTMPGPGARWRWLGVQFYLPES
jgi:peptidoglycan/xylan/chitin deacetylase (PgdA/CDA1 family)